MTLATREMTANLGASFQREVEAASHANLSACVQCAKCTSGCAIAADSDIRPHEMVRLVQLGLRDEVLGSRMIWECTSCETCASRCPQGVSVAAMVDGLRRMARSENRVNAATAVPAFNDTFLGLVEQTGRMYEIGLMAAFKLRTRRFMQDVEKVPEMLRKGKFALLPKMVAGRGERRRMFERARSGGKK